MVANCHSNDSPLCYYEVLAREYTSELQFISSYVLKGSIMAHLYLTIHRTRWDDVFSFLYWWRYPSLTTMTQIRITCIHWIMLLHMILSINYRAFCVCDLSFLYMYMYIHCIPTFYMLLYTGFLSMSLSHTLIFLTFLALACYPILYNQPYCLLSPRAKGLCVCILL